MPNDVPEIERNLAAADREQAPTSQSMRRTRFTLDEPVAVGSGRSVVVVDQSIYSSRRLRRYPSFDSDQFETEQSSMANRRYFTSPGPESEYSSVTSRRYTASPEPIIDGPLRIDTGQSVAPYNRRPWYDQASTPRHEPVVHRPAKSHIEDDIKMALPIPASLPITLRQRQAVNLAPASDGIDQYPLYPRSAYPPRAGMDDSCIYGRESLQRLQQLLSDEKIDPSPPSSQELGRHTSPRSRSNSTTGRDQEDSEMSNH